MLTRAQLRERFETTGQMVRRFRTWEEAKDSEGRGLLLERLPSGYANWFAVGRDALWWVFADASDGGSWSPAGITISGYCLPYDRILARNIYALAQAGRG